VQQCIELTGTNEPIGLTTFISGYVDLFFLNKISSPRGGVFFLLVTEQKVVVFA
jgi:hypothetical protein